MNDLVKKIIKYVGLVIFVVWISGHILFATQHSYVEANSHHCSTIQKIIWTAWCIHK